jgi:hypothetical protein
MELLYVFGINKKSPPSPRPQRSRVFTWSLNSKRVVTMTLTTLTGFTVVGVKSLQFSPEKPSPHLVYISKC